MDRKKLLVLVVLILLVVAVFKATDNGSQDKTSPIKIGAIIFLTGDQAPLGEEVRNALQLAKETSGSAIQLLIEDSHDDPKQALGAYRKLRNEGVSAIIATGDQVNYALASVADRDNLPLFMTVAAATKTSGDYVFRAFITTDQQAELMGNYATKELGHKKLAVLSINNIFGASYLETLRAITTENGAQLVATESFGIADTDLKTQVTKIVASEPDAVVIAGFGAGYVAAFRQLRQFGWQGDILTVNTLAIPYFYNAISKEYLHHTYYTDTAFSVDKPTSDTMKNFTKAYRERFGSDPSFVSAFAYDLYFVLVKQLQQCGATAREIRDCVLSVVDEEGVLGKIDFSGHDMQVPLSVKKVLP